MYQDTMRLARADWAWEDARPTEPFSGDTLIAIAVGCIKQTHYPSAPLTPEDAAILDYDGRGFGNDLSKLRYICSLNL